MTRLEAGARFIRSGFWLLLLGFFMSFGMVLHYVAGAQYPTGHEFMENVTLWWACPWTQRDSPRDSSRGITHFFGSEIGGLQ